MKAIKHFYFITSIILPISLVACNFDMVNSTPKTLVYYKINNGALRGINDVHVRHCAIIAKDNPWHFAFSATESLSHPTYFMFAPGILAEGQRSAPARCFIQVHVDRDSSIIINPQPSIGRKCAAAKISRKCAAAKYAMGRNITQQEIDYFIAKALSLAKPVSLPIYTPPIAAKQKVTKKDPKLDLAIALSLRESQRLQTKAPPVPSAIVDLKQTAAPAATMPLVTVAPQVVLPVVSQAIDSIRSKTLAEAQLVPITVHPQPEKPVSPANKSALTLSRTSDPVVEETPVPVAQATMPHALLQCDEKIKENKEEFLKFCDSIPLEDLSAYILAYEHNQYELAIITTIIEKKKADFLASLESINETKLQKLLDSLTAATQPSIQFSKEQLETRQTTLKLLIDKIVDLRTKTLKFSTYLRDGFQRQNTLEAKINFALTLNADRQSLVLKKAPKVICDTCTSVLQTCNFDIDKEFYKIRIYRPEFFYDAWYVDTFWHSQTDKRWQQFSSTCDQISNFIQYLAIREPNLTATDTYTAYKKALRHLSKLFTYKKTLADSGDFVLTYAPKNSAEYRKFEEVLKKFTISIDVCVDLINAHLKPGRPTPFVSIYDDITKKSLTIESSKVSDQGNICIACDEKIRNNKEEFSKFCDLIELEDLQAYSLAYDTSSFEYGIISSVIEKKIADFSSFINDQNELGLQALSFRLTDAINTPKFPFSEVQKTARTATIKTLQAKIAILQTSKNELVIILEKVYKAEKTFNGKLYYILDLHAYRQKLIQEHGPQINIDICTEKISIFLRDIISILRDIREIDKPEFFENWRLLESFGLGSTFDQWEAFKDTYYKVIEYIKELDKIRSLEYDIDILSNFKKSLSTFKEQFTSFTDDHKPADKRKFFGVMRALGQFIDTVNLCLSSLKRPIKNNIILKGIIAHEQFLKLPRKEQESINFTHEYSSKPTTAVTIAFLQKITYQQKTYEYLTKLNSQPEKQAEKKQLQDEIELSTIHIELASLSILAKLRNTEQSLSHKSFASLLELKEQNLFIIDAIQDFKITYIPQPQSESLPENQKKNVQILIDLYNACWKNVELIDAAIDKKGSPQHAIIEEKDFPQVWQSLPIEDRYAYKQGTESIDSLSYEFDETLDHANPYELQIIKEELAGKLHKDPAIKFSKQQLEARTALLKYMAAEVAEQISGTRKIRREKEKKQEREKQEKQEYIDAQTKAILSDIMAKRSERKEKPMPVCWSLKDKWTSNAAALWKAYDAAHHSLRHETYENINPESKHVTRLYDQYIITCFQEALKDTHSCASHQAQVQEDLELAKNLVKESAKDTQDMATLTLHDIFCLVYNILQEKYLKEKNSLQGQIKRELINTFFNITIGTKFGADTANVYANGGPFNIAEAILSPDEQAEANRLVGICHEAYKRGKIKKTAMQKAISRLAKLRDALHQELKDALEFKPIVAPAAAAQGTSDGTVAIAGTVVVAPITDTQVKQDDGNPKPIANGTLDLTQPEQESLYVADAVTAEQLRQDLVNAEQFLTEKAHEQEANGDISFANELLEDAHYIGDCIKTFGQCAYTKFDGKIAKLANNMLFVKRMLLMRTIYNSTQNKQISPAITEPKYKGIIQEWCARAGCLVGEYALDILLAALATAGSGAVGVPLIAFVPQITLDGAVVLVAVSATEVTQAAGIVAAAGLLMATGPQDKDVGGSSDKMHPEANNMNEFFEKTSLGKLLEQNVKATGKVSPKGEQIYKVTDNVGHSKIKKGDHIHLDKYHKCELEVYDSQGVSKAVVWLDGIVNIEKTEKIAGSRFINV
jgi:sRNA-binding regulator protein Hfq